MSPILVRPVREQLEHDRIIRLLQAKYKRKFEVGINPGNEQGVPIGSGTAAWYPDLVLHSLERGRKLLGVVEVETAESVNNLEAMAQWATFARQAPLHLYIPASSLDVARRLCADLRIPAVEIWAYSAIGDQIRFALVERPELAEEKPSRTPAPAPAVARATAARAAADAGTATRVRPARPAATRTASRTAPAGRRSAGTKAKTAATRRPAKAPAKAAASGGAKAVKRR